MLMKDQKKNIATIIVSRLKDKKAEPQVGPVEPFDEFGSAAEEFMAAIEAKDIQGLKESLKAMIQMCCSDEEESEMPMSEHEME